MSGLRGILVHPNLPGTCRESHPFARPEYEDPSENRCSHALQAGFPDAKILGEGKGGVSVG